MKRKQAIKSFWIVISVLVIASMLIWTVGFGF